MAHYKLITNKNKNKLLKVIEKQNQNYKSVVFSLENGKGYGLVLYTNEDVRKFILNSIEKIINNAIENKATVEFEPHYITISLAAMNDISRLNAVATSVKKLIDAYLLQRYKTEFNTRVVVGHPEKLEYNKLRQIALASAKEVMHTHGTIFLSDLDASQRKIVNKILSKIPEIKSKSIGNTKEKKIKITHR